MKRGTPDHPKMLDLAEAIYRRFTERGVALPESACETLACGTLERLHHHAARYSPAGDIGKHSNTRIAKAVGWDDDAEWIIEQLTSLRWIDNDVDGVRLYIHDWHVHSDDYADRYLADNGLRYANGSMPRNKPRKNSPAATGGAQANGTHAARDTHATRTPDARPSEPESNPESYSEPNPPPPPKPAARAEGGDGGCSWKSLTKQLRKLGLSDADGALAGAQANGCAPIDVACLILLWESRPKCWAVGALHARIKTAHPGEPPETHWPEPSPEWNKSKRLASDSAAKAELARLTSIQQRKAEQDRARLAALEEGYGHILDALSDEDLAEIAAPIIGTNQVIADRFKKTKSKTTLIREQLLTAVAGRTVCA